MTDDELTDGRGGVSSASQALPAGPPSASFRMGGRIIRHEAQVIGNTPELAQPATPCPFFAPILSDDDGQAQEDLAPAKGILASLFIGGVMWLVIIYVLSRVS